MNLHPSLHKALLAGVARAPLSQDSAGPALQALLAGVPDQARLWHSVAASDLWQRAGFQPSQAAAQSACAQAPTCPRAAEQVLQLILRGIHPELLDSWLALAQVHGMALPHAALVPLLEQGLQKPALRAPLATLLGPRGHWLVAQHPVWAEKYGGAADIDAPATHWQLGSLVQRCLALQTMRRADPVAALAALDADWPQEPVENRIALLPCLVTGLGLHDEDFLERALDDKRKEVRTAAQQLLGSLPGSQLAERCKARLAALFTYQAPLLTLVLPQDCDKAMKRDGIGNQVHHGMGEKAGWLLDLMRNVAPTHWSDTWQLTPRQVLDLLAGQEFNTALVTGLVQASARALAVRPGTGAIDWFVTLISEGAQASISLNIPAMLLPDLGRLPQEEQERIVLRWLDQSSGAPRAYAYALEWAEQRFGRAADALPPALARLMLASAQRQMKADPRPDYQTRGEFAVLARALDTGVLDYAWDNWPADDWEHWPQWRALVDDLMETLQFRHTMQAGFLENDA
jgi:hypothetical protein